MNSAAASFPWALSSLAICWAPRSFSKNSRLVSLARRSASEGRRLDQKLLVERNAFDQLGICAVLGEAHKGPGGCFPVGDYRFVDGGGQFGPIGEIVKHGRSYVRRPHRGLERGDVLAGYRLPGVLGQFSIFGPGECHKHLKQVSLRQRQNAPGRRKHGLAWRGSFDDSFDYGIGRFDIGGHMWKR